MAVSDKEPPRRIREKIKAYVISQALEELENLPDPYVNYLNPAAIFERSGLTPGDLAALEEARLLVPDHDGKYRPKLAGWAGKLAYLLRDGWSLAELKAWARGRWTTPDSRYWPPERADWQHV